MASLLKFAFDVVCPGEVLRGDRISNTPYIVSEDESFLCFTMDSDDRNLLSLLKSY